MHSRILPLTGHVVRSCWHRKARCFAPAQISRGEQGRAASQGSEPDLYRAAVRLFECPKPIVAALQGPAIGGGLGLALVADFRAAAPEARFAANFVKLCIHPGFGISATLPRLIGQQRASLMLYTGRRIKAEEAVAWGLADMLAPQDQLRAAACALAAEIAEAAPLAALPPARRSARGLPNSCLHRPSTSLPSRPSCLRRPTIVKASAPWPSDARAGSLELDQARSQRRIRAEAPNNERGECLNRSALFRH